MIYYFIHINLETAIHFFINFCFGYIRAAIDFLEYRFSLADSQMLALTSKGSVLSTIAFRSEEPTKGRVSRNYTSFGDTKGGGTGQLYPHWRENSLSEEYGIIFKKIMVFCIICDGASSRLFNGKKIPLFSSRDLRHSWW